jgi:hypothetical protein
LNNRRVHRCVYRFAAADAFNPDRYAGADRKAARLAFECLPFGQSASSAIDRYVLSLTHIVLATVAQRFSLVPHGPRYMVADVRFERPTNASGDVRIERHGRQRSQL